MGYFRQFDDLGIISVNQWYVLDFGILPHEEGRSRYQWHQDCMTGTGKAEISFPAQTPSSGISTVKVSYGEDSILDVEKAKTILCRTAWISCSLSWKPTDRKGRNQSPGIFVWWIFRRWSCIPCRSSMPATTSGIFMYGWIRRKTGWRWRRSMRQCGIDGKFHGKIRQAATMLSGPHMV